LLDLDWQATLDPHDNDSVERFDADVTMAATR
jgi:hypothetical protein